MDITESIPFGISDNIAHVRLVLMNGQASYELSPIPSHSSSCSKTLNPSAAMPSALNGAMVMIRASTLTQHFGKCASAISASRIRKKKRNQEFSSDLIRPLLFGRSSEKPTSKTFFNSVLFFIDPSVGPRSQVRIA